MRKILLSAYVFFLTPLLLVVCLLFFEFMHTQGSDSFLSFKKSPKVLYAALPGSNSALIIKGETKDARVEVISNFLNKYKSALAPYANYIVSTADKYQLDYRLIPAIAMQESTLCKKAPKNSNNCWGFGIYGKKLTRFDNYEEAIDTVTKTLAKEYKEKGLQSPEEIMSKYTPSNNGVWAENVASLMNGLSI